MTNAARLHPREGVMPHDEVRGELAIFKRSAQNELEWHVQRVAAVVLLALLVAIALGLFGRGGPLSTVALGSDERLQVEYERFLRYHSPDQLRLQAQAPAVGTLRLIMAGDYVRDLKIERITPRPLQELVLDGDLVLTFDVAHGQPLHATIHFTPQSYGPLRGWLAVADGPRLPLSHFVYP
jgi:hypothetical protein